MTETLDEKVKRIFKGKVVNKTFTRIPSLEEFPRYVLEYLIDNYCEEETFEEDLNRVKQKIAENYAKGSEADSIKHLIKQSGRYTIIGNIEVRLQPEEDKYWGSILALNENYIHVTDDLVVTYPYLLHGGMWGTIEIEYDPTEVHQKKIRPFKVRSFTPFQIARINLDEYIEKRKEFTTDEWIDILISSFGLNPERYTRRQKLLIICRAIPLVEEHVNLIELGPRETGKTYLMRNASYYSHVISGGKATPARLFINLVTNELGLVGKREAVVFDEIAHTEFTDPVATVSLMKDYMQSGHFSRGKQTIPGVASIVMVGNMDVQGDMPHEKYYHLLEELPSELQDPALFDRIHAYIPGWEIPKISPESYSHSYGFVSDYLCEIMHILRKRNILQEVEKRYNFVDAGKTTQGLSGRDERGFLKVLSGLLKLLHPHGIVSDDDLKECLLLACELRQRIRNQLHRIRPGEYGKPKLGVEFKGSVLTSELRDDIRVQHIKLPEKPTIGEVIGLGVVENRGTLQRYEVVVTKGSGRLTPLGSMLRVMKESVKAAERYIDNNLRELEINTDEKKELDITVLATQMGIPKEGPSAGLTILVGIISALKRRPVRNDIAITGEITLFGRVLAVGGIQEKIRAAQEAGIKEVFAPEENENDIKYLSDDVKRNIKITLVSNVNEVLGDVLLEPDKVEEGM